MTRVGLACCLLLSAQGCGSDCPDADMGNVTLSGISLPYDEACEVSEGLLVVNPSELRGKTPTDADWEVILDGLAETVDCPDLKGCRVVRLLQDPLTCCTWDQRAIDGRADDLGVFVDVYFVAGPSDPCGCGAPNVTE